MEAKEIKALRKKLGLNSSEFARLVGVERITVTRWESGEARPHRTRVTKLRRLQRKAA